MYNSPSPRRAERTILRANVDFRRAGEHRYRVDILDFSPLGCRIELPEELYCNEIIWISLPGIETLESRVQWVKDRVVGIEFARPIHPAVFAMVAGRMTGGR